VSAARTHLDTCAICAGRLGELEGDRDRFRAAPPPLDPGAAAGRARPVATGGADWWVRIRRWLVPATAVAAAALIALAVLPRSDREGQEEAGGGTRLKGGARLGFYLKRGEEVVRGASGDVLHPGDQVRFAISAAEPGFAAVLSVDGAGRVSVYHPDGARAQAFAAGTDQVLPGSIELDEVTGRETVYGFFCAHEVEVSALQTALSAGRPEASGCRVDRVVWDKQTR
jgi:hypothetical protein